MWGRMCIALGVTAALLAPAAADVGQRRKRAKASKSGASPRATPGFVYYPNCAAARAAGAAPIRAGNPGYSRKLDRDGDGVACE